MPPTLPASLSVVSLPPSSSSRGKLNQEQEVIFFLLQSCTGVAVRVSSLQNSRNLGPTFLATPVRFTRRLKAAMALSWSGLSQIEVKWGPSLPLSLCFSNLSPSRPLSLSLFPPPS